MKIFNLSILLLTLIICFTACKKDSPQTPNPADLPIVGNHWQKLNTPFFGKFTDMQFLNADTGYILGTYSSDATFYNILIKTFDGGNTWQKISYTKQFLLDTSRGVAGRLSIYPFLPNTLFTGGNSLIRSTDGGVSWQKVDTINKKGTPQMHFFDAKNGICVGGGFVSKTVDSGFNWTKVFYPQTFVNFYMLQFTSRQTGFFAGGVYFDNTNGGLMGKTTDGGNTWQLINYPFKDIIAMYFLNDTIGYISYFPHNNIYKTINGGFNWKAVNDTTINAFGNPSNIYFINEKEGFISTQYGIFHTTDSCKSWIREYGMAMDALKSYNSKAIYAVDTARNVLKYTF